MSTDVKILLESLEDFVLNQDKIVTYRWLSKKLNIHVNTSKQLLYTFSKSQECDLVSYYVICGSTSDDTKVLIVNQDDVDKVKSGLDTIISEHVYSVQKSCSPITSSDLYLANTTCETSNNNKLSSILPREIECREIKVVLTEKAVIPKQPARIQQQKEPLKTSLFNSKNEQKETNETSEPKEPEKKKETLFPKKSPIKKKSVSPVKSNKKKMVQSKGQSIGAFFNKQNAANIEKKKSESFTKQTNVEEDHSKNSKKDSSHEVNVLLDEDKLPDIFEDDEPLEELQPVKTPVVKRKKALKNAASKKRKNRNDDNTPAKRRKRIVLVSDSESSGEDEEEEMDLEQEPEAEQQAPHKVSDSEDEVIPPTPLDDKVKKRIRKQIDKTFIDEDGFVITKKEFVYEICSDEDKNVSPVKNASSKTEQIAPVSTEQKVDVKPLESRNKEPQCEEEKSSSDKKKANTKETKRGAKKALNKADNKQASITSFFKRK